MSNSPQTPLILQRLNYIGIATFALLVYDTLLGIAEDIHTISLRRVRVPDIVYVISRLISLAEVTLVCVVVIIPPTSCAKSQLLLATQLLSVLIVPCNAWLFLLRVRSIPAYPGSRVIVLICGVLWLMTCSSALMFRAFKAPEIHLGNGTCILVPEFDGSFLSVPLISTVAFDTATMIAISLGFVMNSPNPTWRSRIKSIIFVGDVGNVSGALLRSGQLYYLTFCSATIEVHLSMTIITLGTSISPPYICQLSILTGVFQTIMTCRVFRLLRLTNRSELENQSSVLVTDSTVLFGTSAMSDQSDSTLR